MNQPQPARRTEPTVPVTSPDFKHTRGADVQATWRRYGWVPPTEQKLSQKDHNAYWQTSQL